MKHGQNSIGLDWIQSHFSEYFENSSYHKKVNTIIAWKREKQYWIVILTISLCSGWLNYSIWIEMTSLKFALSFRSGIPRGIRATRKRYGATPCIFRWPLNTSIAINKQRPLPVAQYDAVSLYLQSVVNLVERGKDKIKAIPTARFFHVFSSLRSFLWGTNLNDITSDNRV